MEEGKVETTVGGGSGEYSYSKNSEFQRNAIEAVKDLINKAISEKLEIDSLLPPSNSVRIADLGCAAGPNTFEAVRTIIDAIRLKLGGACSDVEFQVFFNDQASNDFNQLFSTLPPERDYFPAGVPGSFHGRLFPESSIHFAHSSYSLQTLSIVPPEVSDRGSPAWNGGRVHYSGSSARVVEAYETQYREDMLRFLEARAREIIPGGLVAFVVPGRLDGSPHSEAFFNKSCEISESCFIQLAHEGKISNEKIDSFNLPGYFASLGEVAKLAKENGHFSIEMMENIPQPRPDPKLMTSSIRAGMGGFIKSHFGEEIIEEYFDLLLKKFQENAPSLYESGNCVNLFVLLKRIDHE